MTIDAKNGVFGGLSAAEVRTIDAAVTKCAASADVLIREIGLVYLRGMCDILCVQGRISPKEAAALLNRAKGC